MQKNVISIKSYPKIAIFKNDFESYFFHCNAPRKEDAHSDFYLSPLYTHACGGNGQSAGLGQI